jgi:transcriptional regulator with XRE-family HTH domain
MSDESAERLRKRFVKARETSGYSQAEAARRLGVSEGTVSRKERGELPVKERDATAMERLAEEAKRLGEMVPEAPAGPSPAYARPPHVVRQNVATYSDPAMLPRQLRMMALDFEREALSVGADEAFLRYVRSAFSDPDFTALFAGGPDESPMTPEEEREEMQAVVAEMRALLAVRLRHARERNPERAGLEPARSDMQDDPPPGRRRIGEEIPDPRIAERAATEAAKARRKGA